MAWAGHLALPWWGLTSFWATQFELACCLGTDFLSHKVASEKNCGKQMTSEVFRNKSANFNKFHLAPKILKIFSYRIIPPRLLIWEWSRPIRLDFLPPDIGVLSVWEPKFGGWGKNISLEEMKSFYLIFKLLLGPYHFRKRCQFTQPNENDEAFKLAYETF